MRRTLLTMLLLWSSALAFGQCGTKPTFTVNPAASFSSDGRSITFTATTDVATDFMPMWGPVQLIWGYDDGVKDATGATSHSVAISGFYPQGGVTNMNNGNVSYQWGVRVRKIVDGNPCPQDEWLFYDGGNITAPAVPAGSFDYWLTTVGPHNVVQGYKLYLKAQTGLLQGTMAASGNDIKLTVSGLPPNTAVHWPDKEVWVRPGTISTTAVVNDTYSPYDLREHGGIEIELDTNSGGTTPAGTYTLTLTASDNGKGSSAPAHTATYVVNVLAPSFTFGTPSSYPAIPNKSDWEANMLTFGAKWCLQTGAPVESLIWYYDGIRTFYQVMDYTGDTETWTPCLNSVLNDYRTWVLGVGSAQGWRVFTQGLTTHYQRTGDTDSKAAVDKLASSGAFATGYSYYVDLQLQRELAYRLDAERLSVKLGDDGSHNGHPASYWLPYVLDHVIGQLDQQCHGDIPYWEAFMAGLQVEAIIKYYEDGHTDDLRIPMTVKCVADNLYANYWNTVADDASSFPYDAYFKTSGQLVSTSKNGVGPTSLLNMLIAPMYAWLYQKTGVQDYQTQGDTIWSAGVMVPDNVGGAAGVLGWAGNGGKETSQYLRWSFDYVKWRSQPAASRKRVISGGHTLGGSRTVQ